MVRPTIRQTGEANTPPLAYEHGILAHSQTTEEWFQNLPPITKYYLVSAFLCTILSHFGLIYAKTLIWDLEAIKRFQIWRLVTPFTFFGGLGLNFVMQLFMLVQYSTRYEQNPFNTGGGGGSADYMFMLIFGGVCLHIINLYMRSYIMGSSLVYMITYVWSCRDPTTNVSFWGFSMQAMYLPYALAALSFLISGTEGLIVPVLGMAVGHLYYFLIEIVPMEYDVDLVKTPGLLVDAFGPAVTPGVDVRAPGQPPAASSASTASGGGGSFFHGQGRALGSQ